MINTNNYNPNVQIDDLKKCQVVRPKNAGTYWKGLPHYELVSGIQDEISDHGWDIEGVRLSVGNDGADLLGAFDVSFPDRPCVDGQTYSLGFTSSNARKRKLRFFAGSRVEICSNGMVSGEVLLEHRHVRNLDLYTSLSDVADQFYERSGQLKSDVKRLRSMGLSARHSDQLLMATGRAEIMPWSRLGMVVKEYDNPTFSEFRERNAWSLMNAFTYIVKQNSPVKQINQILSFRNLLLGSN